MLNWELLKIGPDDELDEDELDEVAGGAPPPPGEQVKISVTMQTIFEPKDGFCFHTAISDLRGNLLSFRNPVGNRSNLMNKFIYRFFDPDDDELVDEDLDEISGGDPPPPGE